MASAAGSRVLGRNHHCSSGLKKKATAITALVSGRRGSRVISIQYAADISARADSHQRKARPRSSPRNRKPSEFGRNRVIQLHDGRSSSTVVSVPPGYTWLIAG